MKFIWAWNNHKDHIIIRPVTPEHEASHEYARIVVDPRRPAEDLAARATLLCQLLTDFNLSA